MTERKIYRRIIELGEAIGGDSALYLLLLRAASRAYEPDFGQVTFDTLMNAPVQTCVPTPWEILSGGLRGDPRRAIRTLVQEYHLPAETGDTWTRMWETGGPVYRSFCELAELLSAIPASKLEPVEEAFRCFLRKTGADGEALYGDFRTPKEVIRCMTDLLEIRGGTAYDPCCGTGAMLLAAAESARDQNARLYSQAETEQAEHISRINLSALPGDFRFNAGPANALENDHFPYEKFDYILTNPPFNQAVSQLEHLSYSDPRWVYGPPGTSNCNFAWLQHIVYHLGNRGKAAVIMPNSTLTSQSAVDRTVREALVRSGIVEAIIAFPKYLFYSTEVPFCLWLLNRGNANRESILFLDTTKPEFNFQKDISGEKAARLTQLVHSYRRGVHPPKTPGAAAASVAQIAGNDFLLSPNLYLESDYPVIVKSSMRTLREHIGQLEGVSGPCRAQLEQWLTAPPATAWTKMLLTDLYEIKGGISKPKEAVGHGYPMLDTAAIVRNRFVPETLEAAIDASAEEQDAFQIRQGDIILNRTSEAVSSLACCCAAVHDHNAVYSGYTKRLRPIYPDMLVPSYMAGFFSSGIYRKQIADLTPVFTTRASVNNKTLSKIVVYFPDWEMQNALGSTLYGIFQTMASTEDAGLQARLKQIQDDLIEQFITVPVLKQIGERSVKE